MPRGRPSRAAIHARLAEQVAELRARLGGLPSPEEADGIWTDIWYQEAHHSTAIEGNTLVRRQVELLLKEGRLVGDKHLREYLEVQGYADAARWVYGQALTPGDWSAGAPLSMPEVRRVHEIMIGPAWNVAPHPEATDQEGPGQWRRHEIQPFSSSMHPPPWTEIQARMTDWIDQVNELRHNDTEDPPHSPTMLMPADAHEGRDGGSIDAWVLGPNPFYNEPAPIAELIARVHAWFERIHPFLDGNGRSGRLLTNLMLVRLGYPPAIIQKRERSYYLTALTRADTGDVGPLGELFARAILNNLNRFILPAVAGPARQVPLEALATPKLKVDTLRKAAERGRLRATRAPNGTWRSSRLWVDEYVAARWSRGANRTTAPADSAGDLSPIS
jgi:cell filamentation protein, protein adenylyltransferase